MRHTVKELINYLRNLDSKVSLKLIYKIIKAVETQIYQIIGNKEINKLKNCKNKNSSNKMNDNNFFYNDKLKWINL